MRKPLLVMICQFVCLNHHERRKLTPDYDEGSLEANGLHSDPKKRYQKKKGTKETSCTAMTQYWIYYVCPQELETISIKKFHTVNGKKQM